MFTGSIVAIVTPFRNGRVDERALVLFRNGETVRALDDCCPHAGAPLSEGTVEGKTVTCSWHGWTFDCETGESLDGADASVACHGVLVESGAILVRLPGAS